jgi:3-keto-5-aminohexanoate cleavage enzyme
LRLLAETAERGALIQYILYDPADVARLRALQADGAIPEAEPQVLFVLGRYAAGLRSRPTALPPFLEAADGAAFAGWSVCAFGPLEAACGLTAAGLGGHVRVGFENNMRLADGRLAADNAALVTQSAQALSLMGRRPASAGEARALWRAAA